MYTRTGIRVQVCRPGPRPGPRSRSIESSLDRYRSRSSSRDIDSPGRPARIRTRGHAIKLELRWRRPRSLGDQSVHYVLCAFMINANLCKSKIVKFISMLTLNYNESRTRNTKDISFRTNYLPGGSPGAGRGGRPGKRGVGVVERDAPGGTAAAAAAAAWCEAAA